MKQLGLSKVWVTDHLIGAYCTNVARNGARSDTEKTEDVREFAGQVTHLVYNEDGVSDISLNVLLKPSVADAVNVKAQASGLSTEQWMSRTIERPPKPISQSACREPRIHAGSRPDARQRALVQAIIRSCRAIFEDLV